ncbi:hypothetical protein B0T39_15260 [Chromobacterium haemolyticum]|nr:hypothetical protein B0T39_15260 [Chromobacterium haemolyticum]
MPRKAFDCSKIKSVPSSAMREYHRWRQLIQQGKHPKEAANEVGDTHYEMIKQRAGVDIFSIRLSQQHRVYFQINDRVVKVLKIGGHGFP